MMVNASRICCSLMQSGGFRVKGRAVIGAASLRSADSRGGCPRMGRAAAGEKQVPFGFAQGRLSPAFGALGMTSQFKAVAVENPLRGLWSCRHTRGPFGCAQGRLFDYAGLWLRQCLASLRMTGPLSWKGRTGKELHNICVTSDLVIYSPGADHRR
jgi:hypothetical protein